MLSENKMSNIKKQKLIAFTGAGISAESGIRTFREAGGLWESYDIHEVATPEAWVRNPDLVNRFYNDRRRQVFSSAPNKGHHVLAELQESFDVTIITQNIDDLHERAGSEKVLHLHGEITKARSTDFPELIYTIGYTDLTNESVCEHGAPLRPHIVWFGEAVPMMDPAIDLVKEADLLLIIGTSLAVYPAAGLIHYASEKIPKWYIDPEASRVESVKNLNIITEKSGTALPKLAELLKMNYAS
jgi:NAD-dependent deacetylase